MATRLSVCIALLVFIIRILSDFDVESSMIRSALVFLSLFLGIRAIGFAAIIINGKELKNEEEYQGKINPKQAG